MRITGGALRGRDIRAPPGVRPTQDRIRAALFSMLAHRVPGARVLDLYAGSGALGLEAWSRGARYVCWVESSPEVFRTLEANVKELCFPQGGATRCVLSDAEAFLRAPGPEEPFELVLADPPYEASREGLLEKTLRQLEQSPILLPETVLAFEQDARTPAVERTGWTLVRDKVYGDTRVLLFVRSE